MNVLKNGDEEMIIPKFILTGEAKPVIQDEKKIKSRYTHARWSVIISMIVGYGFYYVCRMALSVIKEPAIESGALTAIQLGVIGSLLSLVYAFGKLTNGFIADRCNIKKFLSFSLVIKYIFYPQAKILLLFLNIYLILIIRASA